MVASGKDELLGGAGVNRLEGGENDDKIVAGGDFDAVSGGSGNDQTSLNSVSATVEFTRGGGTDVVRTGDGDYQLVLGGLRPSDIELIAGGTDFIDTEGHNIPFVASLNIVSVKIKETGEKITFIKQANAANLFDGLMARDGVKLVSNTALFGDTIDQDGPYTYKLDKTSVSNSPLSSIKFADGTVWSAEAIWTKIADYKNNPDALFDLFKPSTSGLRSGLLPSISSTAARMAVSESKGFSDPVSYIDHLNSAYFGPAPLSHPAGQNVVGTSDSYDLLEGGYGNDTLAGGQGDDSYRPGYGDDRILWNVGDGNDSVEAGGAHFGNKMLVLGEGIASSDLRFEATQGGVIISFANVDGSINLTNEIGAIEGRGAFGVTFDDGTVWTHADLIAAASGAISSAHQVVQGTAYDDWLAYDNNWEMLQSNFTVEGGEGDDTIQVRGDGGGTIVFTKGGGHDTLRADPAIAYRGDARSDILSLPDILPSEVTLKRAGPALIITVTSTGDVFVAQDQFNGGAPEESGGVGQIVFADATILTRSDILAAVSYGDDVLVGGNDVDWLFGGDGNDVLTGGAGNDRLDGGSGSDLYKFGLGDGQDAIREDSGVGFGGDDTIEFGTGIAASGVIVSEEDDGKDLVLRIDGTGDRVTIDDGISNPDARVESVRFADGTILSFADLMARATAPTAGDDTIYGSEVADSLSGGAGDDILYGRAGDDVYRFGVGDGMDVIDEYYSLPHGGNDTLELGAGIDPNAVAVRQENRGEDLVLLIGAGSNVTIRGAISESTARIETVRFDDGTVWTFADLMARSTLGTINNDTIYGSELADTLSGGNGNDKLVGRDGSDVLIGGSGKDRLEGGSDGDIYRYARGDGQDVISDVDDGDAGGEDAIEFGKGISASDVIVSQANNGTDLVLQIAGTNGSITIEGGITGIYGGDLYQIEKVRFAQGTTWSFADLMARATVPTAGHDVIYGSSAAESLSGGAGDDMLIGRGGADVLAGGTGNDTLDGGDGNDTYRFGLGDGRDVILESYWDDNDVLELSAGIAPGDLVVRQASTDGDVVFEIAGTSDRVTISQMNLGWATNVEAVRFADGTAWTFADVMAQVTASTAGSGAIYGSYLDETLSGGAGDDLVLGRYGNDIVIGGTGNDQLSGEVGNDTYRFALGDGQDVIEENGGDWERNGGTDTLQFSSGIASGDVVVTRSVDGQSLILSIAGTSDSIELRNAISDEDDRIEQVQFADGTLWSYTDILNRSTASDAELRAITSDQDGSEQLVEQASYFGSTSRSVFETSVFEQNNAIQLSAWGVGVWDMGVY